MKTEQIVILVVAFFLGMLLLNVVKNVCGCKLEEGFLNVDKYISKLEAVPSCNISPNNNTYLQNSLGSCGAAPLPVNFDPRSTPAPPPFSLMVDDNNINSTNAFRIFTDRTCGNSPNIIKSSCTNCNSAPVNFINDPTTGTDQQKQWLVSGCVGDFPASRSAAAQASQEQVRVSSDFAESLGSTTGDESGEIIDVFSDCYLTPEEIETYPVATAFANAFRETMAVSLGVSPDEISVDGISTDDDDEPGCSGRVGH